MKTLSNGEVSVSFDANGSISSLKGADGREWVVSPGLWRAVYSRGEDLEQELLSAALGKAHVEASDAAVSITHESDLLKVRVDVRLDGAGAAFDAKIEVKDDIVVREFQFPAFSLGQLPGVSLLWSYCGGGLIENISENLDKRHSAYMNQDNKAVQMGLAYPGECATNCFALLEKDGGLYFGSHDTSFQTTLHHFRKSSDGVRALLVKYPFLKRGESAGIEGFVLRPFQGSWHEAAKIYRSWADTWFKPPTPPKWIEDFNGWQRLILRHQYGETFFKYSDLPRMHADGDKVGVDTLLLFAWWNDGMDAGYPDYFADPKQGGLAALKDNIGKVKAKGGKAILYFNGHLIDKSTEFYKTVGQRIAIRDMRGIEHTETYNFSGAGTALQKFGNRVFATACYSCDEWFQILKRCVDTVIEAGADGIFFDQLGYKLWPCFDPSHGHPVPDMRGFETKVQVIKKLRDYIESRAPGLAFGTEWLADRMCQNADFIHNVTGGYGDSWGGGRHFIEWFRYCFPEVIVSDREIRDENGDFKRRVNHAVQLGLRSDVEIYRCRATIAETPKYGAYLAKADALRQEFKAFLHEGKFLDDAPLSISKAEIRAKAFESGSRLLVVATHRLSKTLKGSIVAKGFKFVSAKGLGEFKTSAGKGGKVAVELPEDSMALLLFEKA